LAPWLRPVREISILFLLVFWIRDGRRR